MSIWPGIKWRQEKGLHNLIEEDEVMYNYHNQLIEHFGGALSSDWILSTFKHNVLRKVGPSILIKYGKCEHCKCYLGPNSHKRKIYRIGVINSFCEYYGLATKPDNVCSCIEYRAFYREIIMNYLERHGIKKINPPYPDVDEGY